MLAVGIKSKDRTVASKVLESGTPAKLAKSVSPGRLLQVSALLVLGPTTLAAAPLLRIIPESKPIIPVPPVNVPEEMPIPW